MPADGRKAFAYGAGGSLIYGTFPFITITVIFRYMSAVRNLEFA